METEIKQLASFTEEQLEAINSLLQVLTPNTPRLTCDDLSDIISAKNTYIFVAEYDKKIAGMLTLVTYRIPSGAKAWIEDVAVDNTFQGKGIGRSLTEHAINYAKKLNIRKIDLTSSSDRIAANILYQKIGFIKRVTNYYRFGG